MPNPGVKKHIGTGNTPPVSTPPVSIAPVSKEPPTTAVEKARKSTPRKRAAPPRKK